jgi:hypothetical protein
MDSFELPPLHLCSNYTIKTDKKQLKHGGGGEDVPRGWDAVPLEKKDDIVNPGCQKGGTLQLPL